jgi:hypothetical protein
MQDDDSLLRNFVTIKPAAEKILSDGTDVDGIAKYRRARTESLEYLSAWYVHNLYCVVNNKFIFLNLLSFN